MTSHVVVPSQQKRKRRKKQTKKKVVDLVDIPKCGTEETRPPKRSSNQNAEFARPGKLWEIGAARLQSLLGRLRSQLKEANARGDIVVDWLGFDSADKKAIQKAEKENANTKAAEIEQIKKITGARISQLDREFCVTEGVYISPCALKSAIKLGMLDLSEFTDHKEELHVDEIKPEDILLSLKSWMSDYSERRQFYRVLMMVDQFQKKKGYPKSEVSLELNLHPPNVTS